ncbi:MAG: SET domain-containing protein-lysine N-methyltransferase [Thermoplasmata archaeon]|nr:SET domain-containing protein-lysine N-methyltransferase [Thermoplasmata archaeon]
MERFYIAGTKGKGRGLFTSSGLKKGEILFHVDLRGLKTYTLKEIDSNKELDGDRAHYVGRGKYVIEDNLPAFMNHSCDPNCYCLKSGIGIYDVVAFRDIKAGEELTHDYAASSINQLEGLFYFEEECHCGSPDCRNIVHGDFFRLPEDWQRRFYPYLPPSIKRKYRDRFVNLLK